MKTELDSAFEDFAMKEYIRHINQNPKSSGRLEYDRWFSENMDMLKENFDIVQDALQNKD